MITLAASVSAVNVRRDFGAFVMESEVAMGLTLY
jgi:hypothetical protein